MTEITEEFAKALAFIHSGLSLNQLRDLERAVWHEIKKAQDEKNERGTDAG